MGCYQSLQTTSFCKRQFFPTCFHHIAAVGGMSQLMAECAAGCHLWNLASGIHFTNGLWGPYPNLVNNNMCYSYVKNIDQIKSEFCTCNNGWTSSKTHRSFDNLPTKLSRLITTGSLWGGRGYIMVWVFKIVFFTSGFWMNDQKSSLYHETCHTKVSVCPYK